MQVLDGHGYYMMIAAGIESLYPAGGWVRETWEDIGRFCFPHCLLTQRDL